MNTQMTRTGPQEIKRVKGISDKPLDWPRLGTWHLGAEFRGTNKTHPENLDCFRSPEGFDAERWCGVEFPEELQIELPSDDPELCLTDQLEWWGDQEGMKCKGDGETALRKGDEGWTQRSCPCDMLNKESGCGYKLRLWFLLPKAPGFGVWQMGSTSVTTSSRLRGDIQMILTVFGRLTGIPLVLWREPTDFHPLVKIKGKPRRMKTTHHIPRIRPAETMELWDEEEQEVKEVPVTIDLMRKMSAQFAAAGQPALPGSGPPAVEDPEHMPRDLIANATPVYPEGQEPPPEPEPDDPWEVPEPPVYDEPDDEPVIVCDDCGKVWECGHNCGGPDENPDTADAVEPESGQPTQTGMF